MLNSISMPVRPGQKQICTLITQQISFIIVSIKNCVGKYILNVKAGCMVYFWAELYYLGFTLIYYPQSVYSFLNTDIKLFFCLLCL